MVLPFCKLQGTGNDFVLLDLVETPLERAWPEVARRLCDRHYGIGADGLLLREASAVADFRMRVLNADGSEPETCGNGIRCFVRYLHERGLVGEAPFTLETGAGVVAPSVQLAEDGGFAGVRVDMGTPQLEPARIPMAGAAGSRVVAQALEVDGTRVQVTAVSMGNPHAVVLVDDLEATDWRRLGERLSTHPAFPEGANAEFVQVLGASHLRMTVWERGSGPTLACGTGACAATVAGVLNGRSGRAVRVDLPGGALDVAWGEDDRVTLAGPAELVFAGSIAL